MKAKLKTLLLAAIAISVISCKNSHKKIYKEFSVPMDAASMEPPPYADNSAITKDQVKSVQNQINSINKKIIKDGSFRIDIENLTESKKNLEIIVKKYNGYISNESLNNEYGTSEYNIKVRIPSDNFDSVINALETGYKEILSKNIVARDVTEEFIDLESRLKNKKNYLLRYNDLLKQAKSVKDILEIEEKTREIEEEIESTSGRLSYLADLVSYSTLDITLVLRKEYIENPVFKGKFFQRVGRSLKSGWFGCVELIIFLFRIWPLWILTILTIYFVRKIKNKRKD